jgi:hypothetical protein
MRKEFILLIALILFSSTISAEMMITEIMYHSSGEDTDMEWVEIYNNGPDAVNISGWKIMDGTQDRVVSLFRGNFVIPKDNFALLVKDGSNFSAEYPQYSGSIFMSTFVLNNDGEALTLIDNKGTVIDFLNYTNIAKEKGYTIELNGSKKDNSDMKNWVKGSFRGNPGLVIKYSKPEEPQDNNATVPEFSYFGTILALICVGAIYIFGRNK